MTPFHYSCLFCLIFVVALVLAEYPNSLKCVSTLTKPDMKLICPPSRNNFCVKEISDLKQDMCGETQFFGDIYRSNMCEFKKCADICEEDTDGFKFTYGGQDYVRKRYCCSDKDYCNAAAPQFGQVSYLLYAIPLAVASFFIFTGV